MPSARELVNRFSDVKTLPHVAIKVNELVHSETSDMRDFEKIIKMDPVLVTRLLRLVNSAYFGLSKKVESISRAVAYVGMKAVHNLVAVEGIKPFFKEEKEEQGFSRKDLWLHSATVAILAQMIAVRIFGQKGDDVFMAGILHDIGLIVEDQVEGGLLRNATEAFQKGQKSLISCEDEFVGTNHCLVGTLLTEEWNMSPDVLDAVSRHHHDIKDEPVSSVISIVQLAEYFSSRLKYALIPGRVTPLPSPSLVKHVQAKMADYRLIARDLPEEMAKAKELYELDDG